MRCGSVFDGVLLASGTATRWALVDSVNARLLATGQLTAVAVMPAAGLSFGLPPFAIGLSGT